MATRVVSIISRMNLGGPAKLLVDFINHIPDDEFEHILITGRCEPDETDLLDTHKIKSQVIYIDDVKRSIFIINDLKAFIKLYVILLKLKPAIVHTHLSKAGVLGRVAARMSNPNTILIHTFHGHLLNGYFNKFKVKIIVGLEKFLSNFTHTLIAVSHDVKDKYHSLGIGRKSKWQIINPGIRNLTNVDRGTEDKSRSKNKTFNLIWIGRFAEIKNPKLALEVLGILQNSSDFSFHLTMVGDGKLFDDCKKFAQHKNLKVDFAGWKADVSHELAQADLLLFTSENEGFGMVVVEAALAGVLVLSTNSGGITDFIKNKVTGIIVDQSPNDFAKAVLEICAANKEFSEIVTNARTLAISDFSADAYIERHLTLYRSFHEKLS
jgi:glycosyltransferase involved in cell wall biosynthesis